jgi:hypothetical protein
MWQYVWPGPFAAAFSALLVIGGLDKANIAEIDYSWILWIAAAGTAATLSVVYLARRAVWLCLFRSAFCGLYLLSFGAACLFIAMEVLGFQDRLFLAFCALVSFAMSTYWVHTKRTVPYWQLTFALNTGKKIDLRNGVFDVATEWAMFPGSGVTTAFKNFFAYQVGPIAAGLAAMVAPSVAGTSGYYLFMEAGGLFLIGVAGFFDSELYFARKLRELERRIGKPIVMDGYQTEKRLRGYPRHE